MFTCYSRLAIYKQGMFACRIKGKSVDPCYVMYLIKVAQHSTIYYVLRIWNSFQTYQSVYFPALNKDFQNRNFIENIISCANNEQTELIGILIK